MILLVNHTVNRGWDDAAKCQDWRIYRDLPFCTGPNAMLMKKLKGCGTKGESKGISLVNGSGVEMCWEMLISTHSTCSWCFVHGVLRLATTMHVMHGPKRQGPSSNFPTAAAGVNFDSLLAPNDRKSDSSSFGHSAEAPYVLNAILGKVLGVGWKSRHGHKCFGRRSTIPLLQALDDGNQIAFHCDCSHEVKHISAHLASLWICCLSDDLA